MRPLTVHYYDYHPVVENLRHAVLAGLGRMPKRIPPKFFYDARGSQLFDEICRQPEYYPPNAECSILEEHASEIAERVGSGCVLIEPGAGSGHKVRFLLDSLKPRAFVPMDISGGHLYASAHRLAADYPWLEVHAVCDDYSQRLEIPSGLPEARRVVFFPGSSLGNFDRPEALAFLRRAAQMVAPNGALLIGVDVKKETAILQLAYNDSAGVTAAFNLNLLERINRELNGTFMVEEFRHKAYYNAQEGRIEMHLVSLRQQSVRVDGQKFEFAAGESIHTESSYKYTPGEFQDLASEAGFRPMRYWLDSDERFSVHYLETAP